MAVFYGQGTPVGKVELSTEGVYDEHTARGFSCRVWGLRLWVEGFGFLTENSSPGRSQCLTMLSLHPLLEG